MQSEKEYLSQYKLSDYERPSVTTDVAAFMIRSKESGNYKRDSENRLSILLVKRGVHPYKGCWALPGGFLKPDETVEECALREITEETSVTPVALVPVGVFSEPGRDPRGWIISNAFFSIITEESVRQIGGDDASDAQWFDVFFEQGEDGECRLELSMRDFGSKGPSDKDGAINIKAVLTEGRTRFGKATFDIEDGGGLAFDHAKIIAAALTALRKSVRDFDMIFDFLPEKFTLNALQKVQETVMNISLLPANFRRKINDYVTETDEFTQGAGHRPARLYTRK